MKPIEAYLAPDIIVKLFINPGASRAIVEMFRDDSVTLMLSDFTLFEALSSLELEEINPEKLQAICMGCKWIVSDMPDSFFKCTPERKAHLRKIALKEK